MTTLDRLVVSIAIMGLMAMIAVTPFYTRDLVLRGLPERRECACHATAFTNPPTTSFGTNLLLPPLDLRPISVWTNTGPWTPGTLGPVIYTKLPLVHYPMLTNNYQATFTPN